MSIVTFKTKGAQELQANLKALPVMLRLQALRASVSAAAGVVQKAARAAAPEDTGVLRRAIYRTRSRSLSTVDQEAAIVGVRFGKQYQKRGQDAWYWKFLEFGTKKLPARPFIRPAFESTKEEQVKVMAARLSAAIRRITRNMNKG